MLNKLSKYSFILDVDSEFKGLCSINKLQRFATYSHSNVLYLKAVKEEEDKFKESKKSVTLVVSMAVLRKVAKWTMPSTNDSEYETRPLKDNEGRLSTIPLLAINEKGKRNRNYTKLEIIRCNFVTVAGSIEDCLERFERNMKIWQEVNRVKLHRCPNENVIERFNRRFS